MSGNTILLCWVIDTPAETIFAVRVGHDAIWDDVKHAIKETKKNEFADIDAGSLKLWKVTIDPSQLPRLDSEDFLRTVTAEESDPLDPIVSLSTDLNATLPNHINLIIVQRPTPPSSSNLSKLSCTMGVPTDRSPSQPLPIGDHIIRRTQLIELLDQRLSDYHIFQIRGTPACGKSTLRNILHTRLKERGALVYAIDGWKNDKPYVESLQEICGAFDSTRPTYLLFDEAQDTYLDDQLWNHFFKSVTSMTNLHVALFCSYGSASSRVKDSSYGTADRFDEYHRLSLFPTDETPLGLFLSYQELDELIFRYPRQLSLADDVKKEILAWSAGHVGAIQYLLDSILRKNSASMRSGIQYQLTTFHEEHTPSKVCREFPSTSGGRGLPDSVELGDDPTMSAMFRLLLRDGQLFEQDHPKLEDAMQRAHKLGYIYAQTSSPSKRGFVLPTPLHTASLSWMLVPSQIELPEDLIGLVLKVVSRFKYSQLTLPVRRAGDNALATSRPPEAQYQDEFYRALHDFTHGGVQVSPEFAAATGVSKAGRIDFFIDNKKWGIEITRDGKKLRDCFGSRGAYGRWIESGEMSDYILLDCRASEPVKHHSLIPRLFHAVFNRDQVAVCDNNCKEVFKSALQENFL